MKMVGGWPLYRFIHNLEYILGRGGGIYYTRVVQMSEQRVYRRQTSSNVRVVILTYNYRMPTEHTPFQGVVLLKCTVVWPAACMAGWADVTQWDLG
jgi:hypothetical protein